jgi:hypothetical protein
MTVATGQGPGQVLRVQKRILLLAASMARKTAFSIFLWIRAKSENELVRRECFRFVSASCLLTFHMRFAWTMAGFTRDGSGRLGRLQSRV